MSGSFSAQLQLLHLALPLDEQTGDALTILYPKHVCDLH